MSEGIIGTNKNNILFVFILVFALAFHLFLGKLIWDNLRSFGIAFGIVLGIVLILLALHFTLGRKLFHRGGVVQ